VADNDMEEIVDSANEKERIESQKKTPSLEAGFAVPDSEPW